MKKNIPTRKKPARITLRLDQGIKDKWVKLCKEKNNPLNNFITNTVEGKLTYCERREIMKAIEGRSGDIHKVGNNINQIAKYCNTTNNFPEELLMTYNKLLAELNGLFIQHNDCLRKIYHELAK
jgi:hypothetical protein